LLQKNPPYGNDGLSGQAFQAMAEKPQKIQQMAGRMPSAVSM